MGRFFLFTPSKMADPKMEVFTMFDKDGDGNVTAEELALCIRSLDQNPTEKDLADIAAQYDSEGTGLYSFDTFCQALQSHSKSVDNANVIREALRVFDVNADGLVPLTELKHVMVNLGEKQPEYEVDELLQQTNPNDDGCF